MKPLKYRLQGAGLAVVICIGLLAAQAVVSDPVPPKPQLDLCKAVMPSDQGEKVVLWLDANRDGGLSLNWEKHQVLGYGMASVPISKD